MKDDLFSRIGEIFGAAYAKNNRIYDVEVQLCDDPSTPEGALWVPPVEDAQIVEEYDYVESPSFG